MKIFIIIGHKDKVSLKVASFLLRFALLLFTFENSCNRKEKLQQITKHATDFWLVGLINNTKDGKCLLDGTVPFNKELVDRTLLSGFRPVFPYLMQPFSFFVRGH